MKEIPPSCSGYIFLGGDAERERQTDSDKCKGKQRVGKNNAGGVSKSCDRDSLLLLLLFPKWIFANFPHDGGYVGVDIKSGRDSYKVILSERQPQLSPVS